MRTTRLMTWCGAALALGLVSGCNPTGTDDTLTDATPEAPAQPATPPADTAAGTGATTEQATSLTVAAGASGSYLADNTHRTLYLLEGDTDGRKCSDACLAAWPPLLAMQGAPMTTAPNLQADLLGTVQRADGTRQVTYNGHPLYHYAQDSGPGTTAGHDVDDQWGEWYLVTPTGDALGEGEGG